MGPQVPEHKNDQSSDSDEEENVRHDRFRSERFQEESKTSAKYRGREESYSNTDRHGSRRHRGRSPPPRYHNSRGSNSTSSYQHEIRRNNHDRRDRGHHSKSNKNSKHKKETSEAEELKNVISTESSKKTLSSILKNFDDHLESKRRNQEMGPKLGPALPPHLKEKHNEDKELIVNSAINREESVIGPALPPRLNTNLDSSRNEDLKSLEDVGIDQSKSENIKTLSTDIEKSVDQIEGPALPPHLQQDISTNDLKNNSVKNRNNTETISSEHTSGSICSKSDVNCHVLSTKTDTGTYGPVLPSAIEKESYGPALPPNFKKDNVQGPKLPEGIAVSELETVTQEESEDEDMVGPLPEGKMNMTQLQLDLRASHIKRKLDEEKSGTSKDIKKREEWMLELPPEKASNLGLGPRSFRMREAPDMSDRSSWTDTPADKLRKMEQALNGEPEPVNTEELKRTAFIKERDNAMDKMSQLSRDQDRPQSLLELHQKKIKKKKKKEEKEGKKKERRPFDRNIDLQVNRFDEAQKKAIFKKAQLLDTRFSTGESKYL